MEEIKAVVDRKTRQEALFKLWVLMAKDFSSKDIKRLINKLKGAYDHSGRNWVT